MNTNQDNQGRSMMEETKQETRQATGELKEDIRQAGTQLKQKARETTEQIRDESVRMAAQKKDTVAGSLDHLSSALRKAADQLHDDREEGVASVADRLADQVESATRYLRNRDFNALYNDVQGYARQHPEMVFGAMFFAGLAIGRFLKASPHEMHEMPYDRAPEPITTPAPMVTTETQTPGRTSHETVVGDVTSMPVI